MKLKQKVNVCFCIKHGTDLFIDSNCRKKKPMEETKKKQEELRNQFVQTSGNDRMIRQ
jgi:hypothetical protein